MLLYPKWLSYSLPDYTQYAKPEDAQTGGNGYYLISGYGIPSIYDHIRDAIATIQAAGSYDLFVVSLDAEDESFAVRYAEIEEQIARHTLPEGCQSFIVVQDCCIETWLLSNATAITNPPPNNCNAAAFFDHYDVTENDPELLPKPEGERGSRAKYHTKYLKGVLTACVGRGYVKGRSGPYCDEAYWQGMCGRLDSHPQHMNSFRRFVNFLRNPEHIHA